MEADFLAQHGQLVLFPPGPLRGRAFRKAQVIEDGAVAAFQGRIVAAGPTQEVRRKLRLLPRATALDCSGKVLLPGFVDCHTHLVHAGTRCDEFEARLRGASRSLLEAGGGIYRTARLTSAASPASLERKARADLQVMLSHGTTAAEMKSGYGLTRAAELRILDVHRRLIASSPMTLTSTHLAHLSLGKDSVATQCGLIATVAREGLASAFDVFCERGAFSPAQSAELLSHAKSHGLQLRVHAEQLSRTGAAELGISLGALSVDHLEHISANGIRSLARSETIGVLLPAATFHLQSSVLPPVRRMLDKGAALALATDYNPGTAPVRSMQAVLGLACRLYRLRVLDALGMATVNAACAMGFGEEMGSLQIGQRADLVVYHAEDYRELADSFGTNLAACTVIGGKVRAGGRFSPLG